MLAECIHKDILKMGTVNSDVQIFKVMLGQFVGFSYSVLF